MTAARSPIRSPIRGAVRTPFNREGASASGHDGISFNAASGRVVVKAPGAAPQIGTLTSLFTFTGGNQSRYLGPNGFLIASATNTPRIEYNRDGSVRGLLMEASRTNILHQSEDFSTEWTTQGGTRSKANTDMNGVAANMNVLTEDGLSSAHRFFNNAVAFTVTAAVWTMSCYLRAGTRRWVQFGVTVGADAVWATIDTTTWTFSQNSSASGVYVAGSQGVEQINATTYRVWVSGTLGAANVVPVIAGSDTATPTTLAGPYTYTGNGSTIIASGAQLELGAFPSSYIPVTPVAVARTADSCIRTLSTEFSATAGTVVVAGRASGGQDAVNGQHVWEFNNGTASNRLRLVRVFAADTARVQVTDATVTQALLDATFTNLTNYKSAAAWAANDFAHSFNGAAVLTDLAGTVPALTSLNLGYTAVGADVANGHIRTFDYYPSRLSNAQLQQLAA